MLSIKQNIYLNLFITIAVTVWALAQNQITVFYMLYLFWWQEMLTILFEIYYYFKTHHNIKPIWKSLKTRLFMMVIYLLFIVVVFGFIIGFKPMDTFIFNAETVMFKNEYFVVNIILFVLSMFLIDKRQRQEEIDVSPFSVRMIVLHISIILGAFIGLFLLFRVNQNYHIDDVDKWASLLSAVPFLIIKSVLDLKMAQSDNTNANPKI